MKLRALAVGFVILSLVCASCISHVNTTRGGYWFLPRLTFGGTNR